MVKLNKIYTRSGDDGSTALVDGTRRMKSDALIIAYGTVDETNATIGLARTQCDDGDMDVRLAHIQNDLFDLGADLATPVTAKDSAHKSLRITPPQIAWIEGEIDLLNAQLAPLDSFVLPSGTAFAAHLHLARCVARRAERILCDAVANGNQINPSAQHYLNRLSDFLFVAARIANRIQGDVLWKPGAHQ